MQWFPVDKQFRNDWRTKAIRRRFGMEGVGQMATLWSYVATEGSQVDEGRGVQRDGRPLELAGMADDLGFVSTVSDTLTPDVDALRVFLDFLASIGHIDPAEWLKGIVFLPAMNRRLEAYRISKGRGTEPGQVKRGPGRPRNVDRLPNATGNSSGNMPGITDGSPIGSTKSPAKQPAGKTTGNVGKPRGIPGNSGPAKITSPVLPEGSSPEEDDPKIPSPRQLVELWNRLRLPGPKVIDLTDQRKERFRRALKAKPDLGDWEKAITYLNGAAWANAPGGNGNVHGDFRADLDYLAKPGNVTKALERIAAAALPGARNGATGRVAPTPGKFAAAVSRQDGDESRTP